ncbi:TolC family protein [Runella slithyformis]|uniref:Outer membrane efflux protein n=1 Tax=Runella slithyformis (strain ATCC 29530 / DSM 19594 / LMG 11500 / NCIMB 11436 / LSU 4) TaxID=761193 RepID=A0A7U3ZHN4_RUNSL|nr:TolC family protein [Runella slithyformis]AEI47332.1 outer membrane efflux protein [Runella slithyformis DSM 19594]
MSYWSKSEKILFTLIAALSLLHMPYRLMAQSSSENGTLDKATLEEVVRYALRNQPLIRQSIIDERITENNIKSRLADWYPQINFNYNLQHNFIVQTSIIGGNPVKLGVSNLSAGQFTVSQPLFNRDVLLARRTQNDVRLQASQLTSSNKTDLAVDVSKAFYDVLTTLQQIDIANEDIVRLERSLKDAQNQYKAGVADKIDYKRALISLNNTKASKKSNEEVLKGKLEYLKSLMGYPKEQSLNLQYDSLQMEREIFLDTLQGAQYTSRIEYQLLSTQKRLLEYNYQYEKWSYLPTVAANGAYNLNFQNNRFFDLYTKNFPNSFAAITFSLPLYQGGKRKLNINTAEWQLKRIDLEIKRLQLNVNAEYARALGNYKGSLTNLLTQKENMDLAREVYDILQLQYRSGIKAYLEVITSETDLRLARINYYNALYQVLSTKIDVQKALGQLNY